MGQRREHLTVRFEAVFHRSLWLDSVEILRKHRRHYLLPVPQFLKEKKRAEQRKRATNGASADPRSKRRADSESSFTLARAPCEDETALHLRSLGALELYYTRLGPQCRRMEV